MKNNKKQIYKLIFLIITLMATKVCVINPIEEKKVTLKNEKNKITQDIEDVEKYKKQAAELKQLEKIKNSKKLFSEKDDVIEIQNAINKIVYVESIENLMEIDENGLEVSKINLKFTGTYDEIFRGIDTLKSKGLSEMIKSISISKISKPIIPDIEQIDQSTDNAPKKTTKTTFECTLKPVSYTHLTLPTILRV